MTSATLAFAHGSVVDIGNAKATWRELAERFWALNTLEKAEGADNKAAPKLRRVKVFEYLCVTHHMLEIAPAQRWMQFRVPTEPERQLPLDTIERH